ncbi:MAG TPA: DHCW motif cupin fold protein [Thermoanaerobaculia bacterium]|nr:DHCW motif cupin fold protein [Thermoanaerobaculia bacterium]
MQLQGIPFEWTGWSQVAPTEHPGETGVALWRTRQLGDVRVRIVEYSPGYRADHWREGELHTELADGRTIVLRPGMSYQVADGLSSHRSVAPHGAKLFIVD